MAATAKRTTETLEIGGHSLVLSNRNKLLWPADAISKGDLIDYYRAVAPSMLPHLRGRPLTLERYPNGIDEASFFEKHAPRGLPAWIPTLRVPSDSGRHAPIDFILCNDEAALVYVANLAAIVLHVWTSHEGALDRPEFLFFDLDPDQTCTVGRLGSVALAVRATLTELGLAPVVKSSGGSGLHLAVPLALEYEYEFCRGFAELIARRVHERVPEATTLERMPAKRPSGTVYLDYVQVGKGKTLVAPYSVRPRAGAPVSTPLEWPEIEALARKRTRGTEAEFARYTLKNIPKRLAERGDLWSGAHWKPQKLERALGRAQKLWR
ncbi:MAG: non-homologous end-joining DNA ligase [Vulcanimicrobiaceae bacterium]